MKADIDNLETWTKYKKKLCASCTGSCCSLPVEASPEDLVRLNLLDEFELKEELRRIAKRLLKQKVVEHFHTKTAMFTLPRLANGDCIYLNQKTRRCTVYDRRPDTCRNHPIIGPRPGFCPYTTKDTP